MNTPPPIKTAMAAHRAMMSRRVTVKVEYPTAVDAQTAMRVLAECLGKAVAEPKPDPERSCRTCRWMGNTKWEAEQ